MPQRTEFVGATEACRILNIDKATLSRWVTADKIAPAHKLPGRNGAFLFNRADIDRVASEREAATA